MSKLKHYIVKYLDDNGMLQKDFARMIGIQPNTLSQWLNDKREPDNAALLKISQAIGVPVDYLLGGDVLPPNVRPVALKRFPMLGEIACGEPVFANEEHETFIDGADDIDADFCLTCRGDSMIEARIHDGDVVFVKRQDTVENGQIAAVIIEDEATLKYGDYDAKKQRLVLSPANRAYRVQIYEGEELNHIRCLGRAVCFMGKL